MKGFEVSYPAEVEPRISVVICTHNGADTLGLAARALNSQTLDRSAFEVVVVDDASTDDSGEIAAAAGFRVVRRERSAGIAAARNTGLASARGEIIVITDDDCEPEPEWLEAITAPFADPTVDGVTGLTTTASTATLEFRYLELRNPLRPLPEFILSTKTPRQRLSNYLASEIGPTRPLAAGARVYNLVGANMAVRREHIHAVGGYDESFSTSGEDEILSARIQEHLSGARFLYEPTARIAHHYRSGFRDSLRRAAYYGHGSLLFSREKGTLPIIYPFPLAVGLLGGFALALRRPRLVSLALLSPLVTYSRWLTAFPRRGLETFVYPYMQLTQETAFTWGELRALLGLPR